MCLLLASSPPPHHHSFSLSQQQHDFPQRCQLFCFLSTSISFPPLYHHGLSASLDFRLTCLFLRFFQRRRTPQYFLLKNICSISFAMLGLHSEMEGYTFEMPGGMSLVRLFRRNLQMLKSVSGIWELKGSSCR